MEINCQWVQWRWSCWRQIHTMHTQGSSKHFYSGLARVWHSKTTPLYDIILRMCTYWNLRRTVSALDEQSTTVSHESSEWRIMHMRMRAVHALPGRSVKLVGKTEPAGPLATALILTCICKHCTYVHVHVCTYNNEKAVISKYTIHTCTCTWWVSWPLHKLPMQGWI